jgi:hypothetical protein
MVPAARWQSHADVSETGKTELIARYPVDKGDKPA